MTDNDYVAELRSYGGRVTNEAADRIEALTAQLAEDADVRKQIDHRLEELVAQVDALTADNARLRKGCACAMSEIRDYTKDVGVTLNLELAMGWLSTAVALPAVASPFLWVDNMTPTAGRTTIWIENDRSGPCAERKPNE